VQALAGLCMVLFIAVSSLVGARVLLLARRTRGVPELLMGAGMLLVATLGYPVTIAAGFGRPAGEVNLPLYGVGCFLTQLGVALIYGFTWQVFRPAEPFAKVVVAAGSAVMLTSLPFTLSAIAGADPATPSYLAARGWLAVSMVGYTSCFLWTAIEGLLAWRMALRRLALGLSDPVVANRFFLWGLFGLNAVAIDVFSAVANWLGVDPSQSPVVLVPMGVFGAIAALAMSLAFFPPARYLAWLRGGAPAAPR
jgi:hypothetical protein